MTRAAARNATPREKSGIASHGTAPAGAGQGDAPWWPLVLNMTEAHLRACVIECAKAHGWLVMYVRDSRKFILRPDGTRVLGQMDMVSDKGYPDLTLARSGEVLFRELKRQSEHPTPEQEAWLAAVGILGGVWRPEQWFDGTIEREVS